MTGNQDRGKCDTIRTVCRDTGVLLWQHFLPKFVSWMIFSGMLSALPLMGKRSLQDSGWWMVAISMCATAIQELWNVVLRAHVSDNQQPAATVIMGLQLLWVAFCSLHYAGAQPFEPWLAVVVASALGVVNYLVVVWIVRAEAARAAREAQGAPEG